MKFGKTEVPGSLFKLARDRMLRDATFTPADIRAHLAKEAPDVLAAVSGINVNWGIVAEGEFGSDQKQYRLGVRWSF